MPPSFLIEAPIALTPALAFLFVLHHLDSFRLVSLHAALVALGAGGALAIVAYVLNDLAISAIGADMAGFTRYGAPVIEETLKAGVMIYLFQRARIGFLIDAAIIGFAIGAGFALVENLYYLYAFPEASVGTWIVRGFGTAMMHGGATAIFGVLAQSWTERHTKFAASFYLPGLAVAVAVHSLYNHLLAMPMAATAAMIVVVPLILFVVFAKSEHRIHDWLLADYDSHEHLLQTMTIEFAHSQAGRFVAELADKFEGAHAADMFEYMRLHTELVMRAEKSSLEHERGAKPAITDDDRRKIARLHELERAIGRTAMLALWPHLHYSRQELAELYEFESRATHRA